MCSSGAGAMLPRQDGEAEAPHKEIKKWDTEPWPQEYLQQVRPKFTYSKGFSPWGWAIRLSASGSNAGPRSATPNPTLCYRKPPSQPFPACPAPGQEESLPRHPRFSCALLVSRIASRLALPWDAEPV